MPTIFAVSDELPAPADYLAVVQFFLTWYPHALQHPLGQQIRQLTTVPPISLNPIAILLGNKTWRSNYAGDAMFHQAVMKPEPKISGFIDRLELMASISSQYTLQGFPGPGNAGAENLCVQGPDGYVPPLLVKINPDK